ncbi:MAG: hypothetical protein C5B48_10005 [Candidatus Rokuibacteriota bacterium]|nr:MAG: hypothetical protein C5B48_10005 [Candidatus Rokubacteria bacterium]
MAVLLALALISSAAPVSVAAVSSPSGIDPRLRLEWESGQDRSGHPIIAGYVYNDYGRAAINVRLLAEALDASGQVIDRAVGFVPGHVPGSNRSAFSVPLRKTGVSYRISVAGFDWKESSA